ncbi:MAG: acetyl-coenzyme carboxylase carboxyl transferase subunit alpha [Cyanobacteria bacterium RYN_339]|nr:acetyl-coenzyme carboxylase carboxyl transferase subunit alpha [Cyanobacteria bacterium RYN_339]
MAKRYDLEFERPLLELEEKIDQFKRMAAENGIGLEDEVTRLEARAAELRKGIFDGLTPAQRIQIARHPRRPTTLDYIGALTEDFVELHGDRQGTDDLALVGGVGRFDGRPVMFIGHQKGRDTKDNIARNFGMPQPEGYRKAIRFMRHAAKFGMPLVCFIDTPGAYPGIAAEEHNQGGAIALSIYEMSQLPVPCLAVVLGEGGSGGALALGVADRVLMFEHAYYSVITPEGCAAILWKDAGHMAEAATAMKLTAVDLKKLGIVDDVITEPIGGAHQDSVEAAKRLGDSIRRHLAEIVQQPKEGLLDRRYQKFRVMGRFAEGGA